MAKQISQQTFDEAVEENKCCFDMSLQEALDETVQQFESQGVNLSSINITGKETTNMDQLIGKISACDNVNSLLKELNDLAEECEKSMQNRILASSKGAYCVLINKYKSVQEENVQIQILKTLKSLMVKQPDLLDEEGLKIIVENLNGSANIIKYTLKWARECCILSEKNRQCLFRGKVTHKVYELMASNDRSCYFRECLAFLRAFALDDDVRVEFGNFQEYLKDINSHTLELITQELSVTDDTGVVYDILLTLSCILVRVEYCKIMESSNGLLSLRDKMSNFIENEGIVRQSFKVLKALCGNDDTKVHIIQQGFGEIIINSLGIHKNSPRTIATGLGCVAALCLRSPENSKALYEAGLPEIIVDIMKANMDDKNVQKSASWAIRNMVSRSRYQCDKFLSLDVNTLLISNLNKYKDIQYDIKMALRDLGCDIQLNEEWTGHGGRLTTGVVLGK